jgi:N-acetylneuraminate synthase
LLEDLNTPAYKIASFEMIDLPLIKYVASTKKPIIMSTGMADEAEIEEAIETAREAGCTDLVLLHCISSYPAPMDSANLRQMVELGQRFQVVTGLSDHTLGTTASIAAVALGACVIEKHFTLSREDKGPDSAFSIEPQELQQLCQSARDTWLAMGKAGYTRSLVEEGNKIFRRSVYFVRDLPKGTKISTTDIRRIRPGMGLPPKYFDAIVGKHLKVDVKRGTPTSWDILE